LTGIAAWFAWRYIRASRRRALFSTPLSSDWQQTLEQKIPLYRALPEALKDQLHGRINIFLDEKHFTGCGGLEISDEIRLVIAAQACMLLLNRGTKNYSGFKTILVYPDTYVAPDVEYDGMIEIHDEHERAGESWHRGPVVLSWQDVIRDTSQLRDGRNVVLHEFAHKLDEENDVSDGFPNLPDRSQHRTWARVLSREYDALQAQVDRGESTVLDEYGAVSPAEFFAVVTETFFERPAQLKERHPELYEEFTKFYKLDPFEWYSKAGGCG
jgi:Mlc titration factor MtfA (ptsG expression regulator)